MQLYIMRHGEAQSPVGQNFTCDSERPLTQQGRFEAQLMANWLSKMQVTFDHVWVSPFLRAQQTCAISIENRQNHAKTLDFITPSGDAKEVHDFIDGFAIDLASDKEQSILIVSHMPLVSYLVAELTHFEAAPIFATAAIAQIDYDIATMQGKLVRLVSPLDLC